MKIMILILALISNIAFAGTPAQLIRVLDGDTVEVVADVWPDVAITTKLRIYGINSAETRTRNLCEKKKGLAAKKFLIEFLKGKDLTIENIKLGKYAGRVLGDLKANNIDIGQTMINQGHARAYFGGKRKPWCN